MTSSKSSKGVSPGGSGEKTPPLNRFVPSGWSLDFPMPQFFHLCSGVIMIGQTSSHCWGEQMV